MSTIRVLWIVALGCVVALSGSYAFQQTSSQQKSSQQKSPAISPQRAMLNEYCVTCHNEQLKTAGLMLDKMDVDHVADHADVWEKVILKLRGGMMPPLGNPRPDANAVNAMVSYLETSIDRPATAKAEPGRTSLHRLNRTEYGNVIRDLLDLDIDVTSLLPADDEANVFDNIADVLRVSPSLL